MYEHKYDENGLASSYLTLVILVPFALYYTYNIYKTKKRIFCGCNNCQSLKKRQPYFKWVFIALLWLIISFLVKNILTIKISTKKHQFDPFDILKLQEGADKIQIKKSYKKMIRSLRKIINKPEMKESAEEQLKNINKAYDILNDPNSYKSWLNNDTQKEIIIAIPNFFLKFALSSFIVYIIIFTLMIPLYIYSKYRKIKKLTSFGSSFSSAEAFYENIDKFSDSDPILLLQLQIFISKSEEFKSRKWINDVSGVKEKIEKDFGFPVVLDDPGYLHLLDYLFRTNMGHSDDMEFVRSSSLKMIAAFIKISSYKKKTRIFETLLILQKMIIQAVFSPEFYMLQFPNVKLEDILIKSARENTKFPSETNNQIKNKNVSLAAMENLLTSMEFSSKSLKQALCVLSNIPPIEISEIKVFTYDTEIENDSGQMVDNYEPIINKEDDTYLLDKKSTSTLEFKLTSKSNLCNIHSLISHDSIPLKWSIFTKFNGEMSDNVLLMDDFNESKVVRITLPMWSGKGILRLIVVSNGYFGVDIEKKINIKYY